MFLYLDNFKLVNDTHGRGVGDALLCRVARQLRKCVRETDTVSRFGGDEFVALLCDLLKWDDTAMYHAKNAGRNAIRFYGVPEQA